MNLTRKQVDKLIDYLADKTLSFGCVVENEFDIRETVIVDIGIDEFKGYGKIRTTGGELRYDKENADFKTLGHPTNLHDVLGKAEHELRKTSTDLHDFDMHVLPVIEMWRACGITRSLQDIAEGAEWKLQGELRDSENAAEEVIKSPAPAALFSFLIELFPESQND